LKQETLLNPLRRAAAVSARHPASQQAKHHAVLLTSSVKSVNSEESPLMRRFSLNNQKEI